MGKNRNINKQYTWKEDACSELWNNEIFNTVEECIEDAKDTLKPKAKNNVVIGEVIPYEFTVCAEEVLESLEERAQDVHEEYANDWFDFNDEKNIEILSQKLTEYVKKWVKETKQEPKFYEVEIM